MKLTIDTDVASNIKTVLHKMNSGLFLALAPRFPEMRLLRFDGSNPGDVVEVELKAIGVRFFWSSKITDRCINKLDAWFTDEGQKLPWPLQKWKHRHLVTQLSENKSRITDQIWFGTGFWPADVLLYPFLYAAFAGRRKVYRHWFGRI